MILVENLGPDGEVGGGGPVPAHLVVAMIFTGHRRRSTQGCRGHRRRRQPVLRAFLGARGVPIVESGVKGQVFDAGVPEVELRSPRLLGAVSGIGGGRIHRGDRACSLIDQGTIIHDEIVAIHLDGLRLDRQAHGKVVSRTISETQVAREDLLRGRAAHGLVRVGRASRAAGETADGRDDAGGRLHRKGHLPVATNVGRGVTVADATIEGELVTVLGGELAEVGPDVRLAELLVETRNEVVGLGGRDEEGGRIRREGRVRLQLAGIAVHRARVVAVAPVLGNLELQLRVADRVGECGGECSAGARPCPGVTAQFSCWPTPGSGC